MGVSFLGLQPQEEYKYNAIFVILSLVVYSVEYCLSPLHYTNSSSRRCDLLHWLLSTVITKGSLLILELLAILVYVFVFIIISVYTV